MRNSTKLACVIGFVVGTTTALLFAPKKGDELRTQIAKERMRGGLGIESIKKAWVHMVRSAIGLAKDTMPAEAIRENMEELVSGVKTNGRVKMNDLVQKARKVIEQEAETVKKGVQFQVQKMTKKITPKRGKSKKQR